MKSSDTTIAFNEPLKRGHVSVVVCYSSSPIQTLQQTSLSPQPLPRGGLTSAFCFQSLQNTKVGRKKKKNTVSRVIVRLHFLGAFKSFHRLTVVFFLLSLCSSQQQQQLVLSKGRHMLDGVKNIRRLYPTNTPVIFFPLFP